MSAHKQAAKHHSAKVASHSAKPAKAPSQALKQKFSNSQTAGSSASPCPLRKPCNLVEMKIVEPKSGFQDESGKMQPRVAMVRKGQQLNRSGKPLLLANGGVLQITAPSPVRNEPRELEISVVSTPACPGKKHPLLRWDEAGKGGRKSEEKLAAEIKASYFRRQLPGDTDRSFFYMLNSAFMGQDSYLVTAESCGIPQASPGVPASTLMAKIQVFPADEYTGAFTLPAWKKADLVDKQTESWEKTQRHEDDEEIKKAGQRADAAYDKLHSNPQALTNISKQQFHDRQIDQEKKKLDYQGDNPDGVKIKLTQKDGDNSFDANFDDIVKLYKLKTDAVYRMKEIYSWIDKFPQPPGASFKIDVDFLTGSFSAIWGYKEYSDDRVYMAIKGKFALELFKIGLEANLGIKTGGAADAFLFLRAEGSISISTSIARDKPDEVSPAHLDVAGEVKVSGGLQGRLAWVVKVEGKIETSFSAETDGLVVFKEHGLLDGYVTLKRDDITRTVTSSCFLFGSTTEKTVLVKEARTSFPFKKTAEAH